MWSFSRLRVIPMERQTERHFFHNPLGEMQKSEGHKQVIESRIGTDMRSVKEVLVFWIETIKNLNQVTAVVP